jgi:two-component system sensor histidine kinase BaeS
MRRWAGGFRARVFLLIGAVAVVAAGATAFLTVRQATQQVSDSAAVAQKDIDTIVSDIALSGGLRTDWNNLSTTVDTLSKQTGQRIRVSTHDGKPLVDSDTLHGGKARSISRQGSITIDPRPSIDLSRYQPADPIKTLVDEASNFQDSFYDARCLAAQGITAPEKPDSFGIPSIDFAKVPEIPRKNCTLSRSTVFGYPSGKIGQDVLNAIQNCPSMNTPLTLTRTTDTPTMGLPLPPSPARMSLDTACLEDIFRRLAPIDSPPPLSLSIGVGDEPPVKAIALWPSLIAAAGVALVAFLGTLLLSRRVLRPIGTLTGASRRLAAGDLTERVPVRGHDELSVLATSFNSMAESLQASKEQQRNMVADIAHELRTPLANIRGYLEALKDGVIKPETALFVSLYEEAVLQQRLIDDLQDLAQAESGTMIYHRTHLDVAELLNTCRTAHATAADGRGVGLEVYVYQRPAVDGDPDRLRQVLGNLITNALRATPTGGSIKLRALVDQADVVIEVADTGRGIEPDDLAHVFDRFWRADNARGRSTGGRGLGLAIAREIVAAHSGSLTVASEVGQGTVCTIRLPAVDVSAPARPLWK